MVNENLFTLFSLGFNACFILYCSFKLYFEKQKSLYIYILIFSIAFFINRALKITFIKASISPYLWGMVSSLAIKTVMLFFYMFLLSFLKPAKNSVIRVALYIGSGYIIFGMISKFLEGTALEFLFDLYNNGFVFIDLIILLIVFVYLINKKEKHIRLIFYGIIYIICCALIIYFGRDHINFGAVGFTKNILRQIEIIGGFCFFFLAILNKENENEKERLRLKSERLANQLEQQALIHEERTRISHDMHDELGAGISSIKLQIEYLKQKVSKNEAVSVDIDDILKTSEDMNLAMREMLWNLNKENDPIENFILYVTEYASSFLKKANIKLTIETQLQNKNAVLSLQNKRQLLLCLKEALNNIYKHSKATQVSILFIESANIFSTSINDDGLGILSNNVVGNGLKNMNIRMNNINGSFYIVPSQLGLHLLFTIPINN